MTYADGRHDALSVAIKMAEAEKARLEKTDSSDAYHVAQRRTTWRQVRVKLGWNAIDSGYVPPG
jgi:hypothetical protein